MTDAVPGFPRSNEEFTTPHSSTPIQRHSGVCDPTYSGTVGCETIGSAAVEPRSRSYSGITVSPRAVPTFLVYPSWGLARSRLTLKLSSTPESNHHDTAALRGGPSHNFAAPRLLSPRYSGTPRLSSTRYSGTAESDTVTGNRLLYSGIAGFERIDTAETRGSTELIQRHRGVFVTVLSRVRAPIACYTAATRFRTVKSRLCDVRDS